MKNKTENDNTQENHLPVHDTAKLIFSTIAPILGDINNHSIVMDAMCLVMTNVTICCSALGLEMDAMSEALYRMEEYMNAHLDESNKKKSKLDEGIDDFDKFAIGGSSYPENTFEKMVEEAEECAEWEKTEQATYRDENGKLTLEGVEELRKRVAAHHSPGLVDAGEDKAPIHELATGIQEATQDAPQDAAPE